MTDAPSDEELQELGLYDPAGAAAPQHLELLHFLISIGATREDLLEYRNELSALGTVVTARPGTPRYTADEVIAKTGISEDLLRRVWRAAGFADPEDGAVSFSDEDIETLQLINGAGSLFGEEAVIQLSRVIGSSLARVADAAVSSFLVNIEVPIVSREPQQLAIAKANYAAASLLPGLSRAMDVLLRHHILAARRSILAWKEAGVAGQEVQVLAVGFIDLVGSTGLSQRLSKGDLGRALEVFESYVSDAVVGRRGRVVKFIGDEAMFVAPQAAVACEIALEIAGTFAAHDIVPPVRAGIAAGDVLTRDGDYFGPVVNLAARAVKAAPPRSVVVPADLTETLAENGFKMSSLGAHDFEGFDESVQLFAVTRA